MQSDWKRTGQLVAAYVSAVAALALGARLIWVTVLGPTSRGLGDRGASSMILALLLAALAWGLLLRRPLALRVAAWVCLIGAVVLIGAFSPFAAGDYLTAGQEPPSTAWFFAGEALLIGLAYLLHLPVPRGDEA